MKILEDTGKRFPSTNERIWLCECSCGRILELRTTLARKDVCNSKVHKTYRDPHKRAIEHIYLHYQRSAKSRGLLFTLVLQDIIDIITMPCSTCGASRTNRLSLYNFNYTGIDRIDNTQGYIRTNIQPMCFICNRAKGNLSDQEWQEWLARIRSV